MKALNRILWLMIILILLSTAIMAAEFQLVDYLRGTYYGHRFGDACEGMGDVNGDGYADFLVAEFLEKKLHLYLGGPNPFDSPPVITWENHGSPSGLRSFFPVNVGDVDCDGVSDFISVFAGSDTLKLFLGLENLDANDYMILFADTITNWDNFYISGGGDNNDDGNPDFWIYEFEGALNDTIRGYSACSLLDNSPDLRIIRSTLPDNQYIGFGRELCSTCDLNGDSIPDIIYGQYAGLPEYHGRVCIVWGGPIFPRLLT